MIKASREFQVFAKPAGAQCNLSCHYCYYLRKTNLYPTSTPHRMPPGLLEDYIVQHIDAYPGTLINFSWHGGEPTVLGLNYFRNIVAVQKKHLPPGRRIINGIQTNGTLIDDKWCRFFSEEGFSVGISLDGPREMHDRYRMTGNGKPTHSRVVRGLKLLQKYRIDHDILCVVNSHNVRDPIRVYRFFKEMGARYIGFLPLVEPQPDSPGSVNERSVPSVAFGDFLCRIFDEWVRRDIGRIKVQIFEEAARTAFGQDHSLCIFRKTCGDVPVLEHNGDFYSCDHFVDPEHHLGNIQVAPLVELLEHPVQFTFGQAKKDSLPHRCRECNVLDMCNGGCPKNRILVSPDSDPGLKLNYLCDGYKQFFNHCRPFVREIAGIWQSQHHERPHASVPASAKKSFSKTGRNDPCPCGSGQKFKKCCLNR